MASIVGARLERMKGRKSPAERAPEGGLRPATQWGWKALVVFEQQRSGKRDVQERPTAASSRSFYCRPGNLKALRRAPSCDVQEQHDSGVQPELAW